MTITDKDQIIARLERVNEDLVHERDVLLVAIAENVEGLGGEGNDATALNDTFGQLARLLNGKDIDSGIEFHGVAGQIEALVWLLKNATTCDDMEKAELYFARLDFGGDAEPAKSYSLEGVHTGRTPSHKGEG